MPKKKILIQPCFMNIPHKPCDGKGVCPDLGWPYVGTCVCVMEWVVLDLGWPDVDTRVCVCVFWSGCDYDLGWHVCVCMCLGATACQT